MPMGKVLNERQKLFCEALLEGDTAKDAYFAAFPRCRSIKTAYVHGCELKKEPHVAEYMNELRRRHEERLFRPVPTRKMTLAEMHALCR